jgi:hypothetical protein
MNPRRRNWWRALLRGSAAGDQGARALTLAVLASFAAGAAGYWHVSRPAYRYRLALGAERAADDAALLREAQRLESLRGHAAEGRLLYAKVEARQDRVERGRWWRRIRCRPRLRYSTCRMDWCAS